MNILRWVFFVLLGQKEANWFFILRLECDRDRALLFYLYNHSHHASQNRRCSIRRRTTTATTTTTNQANIQRVHNVNDNAKLLIAHWLTVSFSVPDFSFFTFDFSTRWIFFFFALCQTAIFRFKYSFKIYKKYHKFVSLYFYNCTIN